MVQSHYATRWILLQMQPQQSNSGKCIAAKASEDTQPENIRTPMDPVGSSNDISIIQESIRSFHHRLHLKG